VRLDRNAPDRGQWLLALLLALCANAAASAVPDPERAFADRNMAPVEAWLAGLPDHRRDSTDALRARAWLARRSGDSGRALEWIDRAIERAPERADLRVDRAAIRSDRLRDAGAFRSMRIARAVRRDLETAVASEPTHAGALVALITFHREAPGIVGGDESRAEELMSGLREVSAAHFDLQRAMRSAEAGDPEAAVAAIRAAIDREPDPPLQWFLRLGRWLADAGRPKAARDAYLEALVRYPGYGPALHALGTLCDNTPGGVGLAIDALRRYLATPAWPGDPAPAGVWRRLARLYREAGDPYAARRALRRAESAGDEGARPTSR